MHRKFNKDGECVQCLKMRPVIGCDIVICGDDRPRQLLMCAPCRMNWNDQGQDALECMLHDNWRHLPGIYARAGGILARNVMYPEEGP